MHNKWQKRSQSAQGMVEFALVLPVLLMLILGIFAFGHFFFVYITTVSASREAARYGSAMGPSENGIARFTDCQAIRDSAVRVGSIAGVSTVNIHFDDGANQIESCPVGGGPVSNPSSIGLGDRIVVEVTTNYQPIVPMVSIPSFPITSRSVRTILRNAPVGTAAVALPVQSASKENTTLTIVSDNPDYSKVGIAVDVYFTMTHTGSLAAPTGDVSIIGSDDNTGDGNNDISCTATLAVGHCIITPDVPGPWTITAVYAGDTNYNGSMDTEAHQVYYFTSVDITSHNPNPSTVGSTTPVEVYYSFATDPVVSGGYAPSKLLHITDGTTICQPSTNTTGPCSIPAYTDPADRVITISYPVDDPYFLPSTKSVDHVVNSGYATTTTINEIVYIPPAGLGTRAYFEIGDQVEARFSVVGNSLPASETARPTGTVRVSDLTGLWCEAAIAADGTGKCTLILANRGTSGTLTYTATFIPSGILFDDSTSASYAINNINKAKPVLTVLGHTPDPSGVNNFVAVTFSAAPVSPTITQTVTGKVRVTIQPNGNTCEGTLDATTGEGNCNVLITSSSPREKTIVLDYVEGDNNFEGPATQPIKPTHIVDNCPTVSYRTFYNTGTSGSDKKDISQMVVTVSNPLTDKDFRIVQVNANWPSDVQTVYIKELQIGPVGDDVDGNEWDCSPSGSGKKAEFCLWNSSNNLGLISHETATRDYFSSAASVWQPYTAQDGTVEPTGTGATWKTTAQTDANTLIARGSSQDLYFVLSVNAPKVGVFKVRVRFDSQTCPWSATEFYNNTP